MTLSRALGREKFASVKHQLSRRSSIARHCKFGGLTLLYDTRKGTAFCGVNSEGYWFWVDPGL